MTAHDDAIEAGASAAANGPAYCVIAEHGASGLDPQRWTRCPDCVAAAVVDAVEPIIRADERERLYTAAKADSGAMFGIVLAAEPIEDEVRERLRAQVEALPERADAHDEDCPGRPGRRGICNCEGDILISRRAVLALLGGESE